MSAFKPFIAHSKLKLDAVDTACTPFLEDTEEHGHHRLDELAEELDRLQNLMRAEGRRKLLLVLQGMDTSGKDGTIRWVFSRTSPLGVRVTAFKAPTEDERARDFLWRCHAMVPRAGEIMIWNRSHYEDVLVPVVQGSLAGKALVERYEQINQFERLLVQTGTTIIKCMLHIGRDEQRKRLQERLDEPDKRWKFAVGDLDVRRQWDEYQSAYQRALRQTSTNLAPWYVIPSDHKLHRNLMIARLLVRTMKRMHFVPNPGTTELEGLRVV